MAPLRNAFPFLMATFFGVTSGIFIFKPMIIEYRIQQMKDQGLDVGAIGDEKQMEAQVLEHARQVRAQKRAEGKRSWWPF